MGDLIGCYWGYILQARHLLSSELSIILAFTQLFTSSDFSVSHPI